MRIVSVDAFAIITRFLVPQERKEEIEQKKEREKEILIFFYEGGSLPDRSYDKGWSMSYFRRLESRNCSRRRNCVCSCARARGFNGDEAVWRV